ncbi:MAG: NAD-dependent epimerase/dehydratase family protein [Chitinophagaceae bacterium]|nr:NAD-dependent epimerase/dehydratase family protein [Chitinophagaceae bacterium]
MIFVTGGTGLLGSYLLRDLVAGGKEVSALYRTSIPDEPYAKSVHWIQGDILDVVLLEEIMQKAKQVYHCAAIVSFNPAKKYEMLKINAEGTANVVNAALAGGVQKLMHVSSVSALGRNTNGAPISEDDKWDEEKNKSAYGKSKYFAELEVWRGVSEGLNAVIVNPSTILGVGKWEKDGSAAIFKKAYEEFPWYTDGVGGFVDVADVAKAMIQLMESDISGERFIVNAESLPFKNVFTEIANAFGKKPPYKKAPPFMIKLLWRLEKLRSFFTSKDPLITKETAGSAQRKTYYDNSRLLKFLPGFQYKPVQQTIKEYSEAYMRLQR